MTKAPERFSEYVLPGNYIQFSPVTAEIFVNGTQRGWALDANFLRSLHGYLRKYFAKDREVILYRAGFEWGERAYQRIETLALSLYPGAKNIKELSMDQFHRLFTNHIAATGWGNFELKRRDDFLFVDLFNSLYADMLKASKSANGEAAHDHTACHLYAGFFAGLFGRISNMPLACIEITCQTDGYENCSFLLDSPDTIASVEKHIHKPMAPLEAFQTVKKEFE